MEGRICPAEQWERIQRSFEAVTSKRRFTIVEGTGHVGVGSVVGLGNAEVARRLGIPVVLIGTGGVGSTYDELALNKQLCDNLGVSFMPESCICQDGHLSPFARFANSHT